MSKIYEEFTLEEIDTSKSYDVTYCNGTPNEVTLHIKGSLLRIQKLTSLNQIGQAQIELEKVSIQDLATLFGTQLKTSNNGSTP